MSATDFLPTAPGRFAARVLKALAVAKGDPLAAAAFVDRTNWSDAGRVKAALLDTSAGLVLGPAGSDFTSVVRARSLLGRLVAAGARVLPPRTPMVRAIGGVQAAFTGEGQPMPFEGGAYTRDPGLPLLRVAGAAALTRELVESSAAESIITGDLIRACVQALDAEFADPSASPGAGPGSVFAGAPSVSSSGSDADAIRADVARLLDIFGGDLQRAAFVCDTRTAMSLALVPACSGDTVIDLRGDSRFAGLPLFASDAVPRNSNGSTFGLIDISRLEVVGLQEAELRLTDQASVELSATPTDPANAGATLVSLWQQNLLAIGVQMQVNWRVAPGAAAYISGVTY